MITNAPNVPSANCALITEISSLLMVVHLLASYYVITVKLSKTCNVHHYIVCNRQEIAILHLLDEIWSSLAVKFIFLTLLAFAVVGF